MALVKMTTQKSLCFQVQKFPWGNYGPGFLKERDSEVELCRKRKIPYKVIPSMTFGRNQSLKVMDEQLLGLGYSRLDSLGFDGSLVFFRGYVPHLKQCLDLITQTEGINVLTIDDVNIVNSWPNYVNRDFSKRKVDVVKAEDLVVVARNYSIDGNVFVKTLVKMDIAHGKVISLEDALTILEKGLPTSFGGIDTKEIKYETVNGKTDLLISEPLGFKEDDNGRKEYRFWVFNGRVIAGSRYGKTNLGFDLDALKFATDFAYVHGSKLPKYYVADFGETVDRGFVLVELNDIMTSGNTNDEIFGKVLDAYLN